jgi:hypothetical protein
MTAMVYPQPQVPSSIYPKALPAQACGCPACRSGLGTAQLLEMSNSEWLINRLKVVGDVVVWDDRRDDEGL